MIEAYARCLIDGFEEMLKGATGSRVARGTVDRGGLRSLLAYEGRIPVERKAELESIIPTGPLGWVDFAVTYFARFRLVPWTVRLISSSV